jgi:hypothetical protein
MDVLCDAVYPTIPTKDCAFRTALSFYDADAMEPDMFTWIAGAIDGGNVVGLGVTYMHEGKELAHIMTVYGYRIDQFGKYLYMVDSDDERKFIGTVKYKRDVDGPYILAVNDTRLNLIQAFGFPLMRIDR